MGARKLNVLVYTGSGTTSESVRHCMYSLRRLLSPNYAVIPITETVLLKEPWAATCALLVIPGGGDLGYCRVLNGEGNRRISDFVRRGGSYLGLCAGGYYGSRRCEFEVGNKALEVIGPRELGFFPGVCRGGALKGFEYHGEKGARAVRIKVMKDAFPDASLEDTKSYFNGGGVFVDAAKYQEMNGVEILATYKDSIDVDGGDGNAAVVLCKVGDGKALLTGPHPEFAPVNLHPQPSLPNYADLVRELIATDKTRHAFFRACLTKLGLEVAEQEAEPASILSALHLASMDDSRVTELLCNWEDIMEKEDGEEFIRGETDTFHVQPADDELVVEDLQRSLASIESAESQSEGFIDYTGITKKIIAHEKGVPPPQLTPQFDFSRFFSSLKRYRMVEEDADDWGNLLLYGAVVTSTNTLLEKNPKILSKVPTGFTFTATTQVAGRGRGSNVWLAPPGSLLFSTVIDHPAHLAMTRPVVFIQYIAAVAIVEAIRSYGQGYEKLDVRLKWPNDIYARDPTKPDGPPQYVKIGGILSQCAYSNGSYQIVLGIGVNAVNPRPTTSISDLLPESASPLHIETLLARILTRLESIHRQFLREGFSSDLETRYYRHWLHTGQAVTLEEEAGAKARVLGITRDWGMLRVEETDRSGRGTGRIWTLQSDENSFDYWKGLVRRKT